MRNHFNARANGLSVVEAKENQPKGRESVDGTSGGKALDAAATQRPELNDLYLDAFG